MERVENADEQTEYVQDQQEVKEHAERDQVGVFRA